MNATELLDQFVQEAREGLESVGQRLLEVERRPDDAALLNELFRLVHTLKGNCGLFEFRALEQLLHAAEDLLDRVRDLRQRCDEAVADALLEAMDLAVELVDAIAAGGALPADAPARAEGPTRRLRALQQTSGATVVAEAVAPAVPPAASAVPAWVLALPQGWRLPGRVVMRYRPEPECFFKGEDPWRLAVSAPGLQELQVAADEPWPEGEAFDCYRCLLVITLSSDAASQALLDHFRCVPEQIEWHAIGDDALPDAAEMAGDMAADTVEDMTADTVAGGGPARADPLAQALRTAVARVWDLQQALLGRSPVPPGTLQAVRRVFARQLAVLGDAASAAHAQALAQIADDPAALIAWADGAHPLHPRATPGGEQAESASPAAVAPAGPTVAAGAADVRRATADDGAAGKVVKVAQDKIDRMMDLIGEMVVAKNALPYLAQRADEVFQQRELAREIRNQYGVINRIAEDMQRTIMQVRMLPVGTIFQRFGRLVRDISRRLGKDVRLVIEGEETEAEKTVIESLADPLIHILRNSLDHGIERPERRLAAGKPAQGTLHLSAAQDGDRVVLDIRDDGAGIDTDRVRAKAVERGLIPADRAAALSEHEAAQLVFLPGFSTADAISDLSGRGVGMDVVRSAVERINGTVSLSSTRGQGTHLRLSLPLSMAVTHVMVIGCAGQRFGVPMDLIVETVRVPAEDIHRFKSAQTAVLRGRIVPLVALHERLALDEAPQRNADDEHAVLVLRLGGETLGLLVDDFHGTSDIILKPMDGVLAGLTGFAGTALMGDGSVLMVLNPKELLGWASGT